MTNNSAQPLARERNLILASLLIFAAAAWAILIWQSSGMSAMGLKMGMSAPLFLAIWIVMMIAMMFPTAAPMILTFARVHDDRREKGKAFVPTWVFVSAYLLIWTLFGVLAYALALGAEVLAKQFMFLMDNAARQLLLSWVRGARDTWVHFEWGLSMVPIASDAVGSSLSFCFRSA